MESVKVGGTRVAFELAEGRTVTLPLVGTVRAFDAARKKAECEGDDGTKYVDRWAYLDAIRCHVEATTKVAIDDDEADFIEHSLGVAYARKKGAQRADYEALATSPSSTDPESSD